MVQYEQGKWIDQSEITVEQWAEFVFDGNEKHKPKASISHQFAYHQLFYPNQEPDSLYRAYGKIGYYALPVIKTYFDTLNYKELRNILDYPISGISYDDALAYCAWRTEKYKQLTDFTKQNIRFELPEPTSLTPLPSLTKLNKNNRPIPMANFKEAKYIRSGDAPNNLVYKQIGKQPVAVMSFDPNTAQVYDLNGNVAEMTKKEFKAIGGSFNTSREDIDHNIYEKPEAWLGFRCVGIVSQ